MPKDSPVRLTHITFAERDLRTLKHALGRAWLYADTDEEARSIQALARHIVEGAHPVTTVAFVPLASPAQAD